MAERPDAPSGLNFAEEHLFREKSTLDYKTTFNIHVNRMADFIPKTIANGGFQPNEVVSVWVLCMTLHGFILAGKPEKNYKETIDPELQAVEDSLSLNEIQTEDKVASAKKRLVILKKLMRIFVLQLEQMHALGMTGYKSIAIINGPAPGMELEDYILKEGDLDYLNDGYKDPNDKQTTDKELSKPIPATN